MIYPSINGISLATPTEQRQHGGKWICPECGHKTFVCYLDTNRQVINERVGKCDRADNCAYHYTPKQFFMDNGISPTISKSPTRPLRLPPSPSYIVPEIFKKSLNLNAYKQNNLITFLGTMFGTNLIEIVVADYYIGTANYWSGSTVFWQIDRYGKVHGGKIMLYNAVNGKRVKEPFSHITWVHSAMKLSGYNLRQCLFGEHLLRKYPDKTIAIVESEKTAVISSLFFPDVLFLACGGCGNLTAKICSPLKGRDVMLFPDNGKFKEWSEKGSAIKHLFRQFSVSDIMEQEALNDGEDIADMIIREVRNELTLTSELHEHLGFNVEPPKSESGMTDPIEREVATERTAASTNQTTVLSGYEANRWNEPDCDTMNESDIVRNWRNLNPSFNHLCNALDLVIK